jgi:hypothetical protein
LGQFDIQESTAETDGHLERLVQLFLFEEIAVLGYEHALLAGHSKFVEDGVHRAYGLAIGAVDAGNGVDEVLFLVVAGVDAIDGANFDAGRVFHADAGLGYYKRHTFNLKALPALTVVSVPSKPRDR